MARLLRIKIDRTPADFQWDPQTALADALAEKERFLQKNPRLQTFQEEIDQVLDKAGSRQNRLAVIALMLETKLIELHRHLQRLNGILLRSAA